jgi:hypothetical protein
METVFLIKIVTSHINNNGLLTTQDIAEFGPYISMEEAIRIINEYGHMLLIYKNIHLDSYNMEIHECICTEECIEDLGAKIIINYGTSSNNE